METKKLPTPSAAQQITSDKIANRTQVKNKLKYNPRAAYHQ